MSQKLNIQVLWTGIKLIKLKESDFVSLTDIARYKNQKEPKDVVRNWLRLRNTIDYLGLRETINNPDFKGVEFDSFKAESGTNAFTLSPQLWIEKTNAIWIISKSWNNWWTFAHKDIAMKFASRISVEFELYLIKEFQKLKEQELTALDRNVKRFLTKINYKIHTDAIKNNLVPQKLTKTQINLIYANEADVLNVALFGKTAKERREKNPWKTWNMRDDSTIEQLIVLANIESMNAEYIKLKLPQSKRLELLNKTAISQIKSLLDIEINKELPHKELD